MYDLKHTFFGLVLEKEVATGSVIAEEGMLLVRAEEAGIEKVKPCNSDASGVFVGFATMDNQAIDTKPSVEDITVPATPTAGAYIVQLNSTNIVESSAYGTYPTGVFSITYSATFPGAPAAGACIFEKLVSGIVTGRVSFNVARAGEVVHFQYTQNLTVEESRMYFYQRNINNQASAIFGQVGVGKGHGEIYLSNYDTAVAYDGNPALKLGPAGKVTTAGGGATLANVRVIKTPTVDSPLLGLAFDII